MLVEIQDVYNVISEYYHHRTDLQHKALKDALSRVPPAQSEPHWIPVDERLPEDGSTCLISLKSPFAEWVSYAIFSMNGDLEYFDSKAGEGGFYSYDSEYGFYKREGVTAWMPLPEPYRKEGD